MSDADERSLADEAPEQTTEPRDATVPTAPQDFDFAGFVAGIRPARRAVTIYARGDLAAERDILRSRIQEAQDRGAKAAEVKKLRDDLAAVTEQMTAPGAAVDVVLEGRSSEAIKRLTEALEADGVTEVAERDLHLIAAQIVSPAGADAELLKHLREVSEPQYQQVMFAAVEANTNPGVVTPDFSRGRSATTRK